MSPHRTSGQRQVANAEHLKLEYFTKRNNLIEALQHERALKQFGSAGHEQVRVSFWVTSSATMEIGIRLIVTKLYK